MAKVVIQNTTKGDLGLNPALVIPAMGAREVNADDLADAEKSGVVKHYFAKGMLKKPAEPKPAPKAHKAKK
jgi:hypothetical protein